MGSKFDPSLVTLVRFVELSAVDGFFYNPGDEAAFTHDMAKKLIAKKCAVSLEPEPEPETKAKPKAAEKAVSAPEKHKAVLSSPVVK